MTFLVPSVFFLKNVYEIKDQTFPRTGPVSCQFSFDICAHLLQFSLCICLHLSNVIHSQFHPLINHTEELTMEVCEDPLFLLRRH